MSPGAKLLTLLNGSSPYFLPNIAARYSLDGAESDSTYKLNSGNVALIADRSGNSAVNGLVLNATSGNDATSPDSDALRITSTIDLIGLVAMNDYTIAASQSIGGRYTIAGSNLSYALSVNTGKIRATIYTSGASTITVDSTTTIPASNFAPVWVRALVVPDDGAGNRVFKFYYSLGTGTATWTQLGSAVTAVGAVAINAGTANLEMGQVSGTNRWNGILYRFQIWSGDSTTSGNKVFDANFTTAAKLATSFTESSSNAATVTINSSGERGARISGARDYVQLTAANQIAFSAGVGTADGSNDNLRTAPSSIAQNFTRISVISQSTWSSGKYLLDGASGANSAGVVMTTGTPQINLNAGASVAGNTGLAVGAVAVVIQEFAGAASTLQINNGTPTTGDAGSATPNGLTLFASGAATAANFANGTFREEIVFTGLLSANTKRQIVAFFRRKYPAIAA